jgi:hypothetical protein
MRASLMLALLTSVAPWALARAASFGNGPMTNDQVIASAESAAPAAVAKDAEIVAFDAQGTMRTIRKGTNGFTCMPDVPDSPGPDPMCVDKGGMEWTMAVAAHRDPPKGVIGAGYMLAGGSDPDNMDPFATKPPAGMDCVTTGPHLMLFNVGDLVKDHPTAKQPDTSKPYVMYPNTVYAHIMVPVKR